MPDEKTKSSNVPKQKSSRQTHINDLLITTAYRQQIRNEFLENVRQMFEMYMKEFRFDKIYIDDLIEGAVNEFALTEPTFRSHDNTIEMELMRKIAEKEKQIENEEIQHRARMLMMEREKEKLQMEIKMLEDEAEQKRKHALNDEDTEKRWLQKEIESLEEGLKRINTQIETLRRS
ncbi:hypothetical protein Tcan_12421 [Toxocara canis]|uniref:Uncharacterized protein n=1 Tax=Toxocara canis TaxID=6265 RepID=A0A0B2VKD8_TOXCA|nr:hypothetical protein Tcan_12421 [Toxocara canis]